MSTGGGNTKVGGIYADLGLDTAQLDAALKAAEQRMADAQQAIAALIARLRAGEVDAADFGKAFAGLSAEMARASKQADGLRAAIDAPAAAAAKAAAETQAAQQKGAAAAERAAQQEVAAELAKATARERAAAQVAASSAQINAMLEAEAVAAREAAEQEQLAAAMTARFYELEAQAALAASAAKVTADTKAAATKARAAAEEREYSQSVVQFLASEAAAARSTAAVATGLGAATAAAAKAKGGFGNLTTIVQQGGYALGDLASTSGDLGMKLNSVANNVQFAAAGFGPWGVAAGLAVVAGVALVRNFDALDRSFSATTPFPRAADDVAALRRELDHARESMGKLEQQTELTAAELEKYNQLREDAAAAEARIKDAEARKGRAEQVAAIPQKQAEEQGKGVAEALQEDLGPGLQGQLIESLTVEMAGRQQSARDELMRDIDEIRAGQEAKRAAGASKVALAPGEAEIARLQAELAAAEAALAGARALATDTVNKALTGDIRAFRQIEQHVARNPEIGAARAAVERAATRTPEEIRKRESRAEAEREDFVEHMERKERERADRRLGRDLTAQGQENQEFLLEQRRREAREAIPAVGEWAARASRRLPAPEVARQIGEALARMGYSEAEAKPVAKSLALEGEQAARREAMERVLNPPRARVLDMADIAWGIQGAASAGLEGIGKETNSLLKALNKSNDMIADAIARQRAPRFEKVR
jgi:hypothetical protein